MRCILKPREGQGQDQDQDQETDFHISDGIQTIPQFLNEAAKAFGVAIDESCTLYITGIGQVTDLEAITEGDIVEIHQPAQTESSHEPPSVVSSSYGFENVRFRVWYLQSKLNALRSDSERFNKSGQFYLRRTIC